MAPRSAVPPDVSVDPAAPQLADGVELDVADEMNAAGVAADEVNAGFTVDDPSAAPVRLAGMHSRAGNAMNRTRRAVLDGAAAAVAERGARKATMADIAAHSGIAKGTLYNHFRTKEAVFAAAIDAMITKLADNAEKVIADRGLAAALRGIAAELSSSLVLVRLRDEPAALAPLVAITDSSPWVLARVRVADLLTASGGRPNPAAVDLVLRTLVSYVASPSEDFAGLDLLAG